MSDLCETCKEPVEDKFANCDSCHVTQHPTEACTGLSPTELRSVVLSKRTLVYFCQECRESFRSVPVLLREIRNFKNEVSALKVEVNEIRNEMTSLISENKSLKLEVSKLKNKNSHDEHSTTDENIMMELIERQKREKNIIIANLKESQASSPDQRRDEDQKQVKEILTRFNINVSNIIAFRIGKIVANKNRLVKVIMDNKYDAITVLKKSRLERISTQSIRIFSDQTKKQKDYYTSVKNKLQELIENGDDSKTIKYINNIPTLVNKSHNQKN